MKIEIYIQLFTSIVALVGVVIAILQLRRILRSLQISQQGNSVNVIAHCVNRYEKIMSEIPTNVSKSAISSWWYRYWNLYTEEFNFFRKSLLDPDIYELWMNELATVYHLSPRRNYISCMESHQKYLKLTLPCYIALHKFFNELDIIANDSSLSSRSIRVHKLIMEFAPSKALFEISMNEQNKT
jgi:hypothetical protein